MPPSPTDNTTSSYPDGTNMAQRLPAELIQQVLADLPQRDLRVFARASHACYAHALEAGLRIHRHVHWIEDRGFGDSLQKLDMVLDHAAERPELNIAITAYTFPHRNDTAYREAMQTLLAAIRRALPNLVRLVVPLADYTALCADSAPKLLKLAIHHSGRDQSAVLIPSNIFAGVAPKLRTLELSLEDVEPMAALQPIAAFHGVTCLKLRLAVQTITQPLPLQLMFPALRALKVEALYASGAQTIDLCGLCLRHFAFSGDAALLTAASAASLRDIPVVRHRPPGVLECAMWPVPSGELCAVAERHVRAPTVSIGPRDGGAWRRTAITAELRDGALPLAAMPILASNLVSITIQESLITAFVQTPIVLAALRELFVDLSVQPARGFPLERLDYAVTCVRCPALERVVLFAVARACAVGVGPHTVARLGYTLGLRKARPALILATSADGARPTSARCSRARTSRSRVLPRQRQRIRHSHLLPVRRHLFAGSLGRACPRGGCCSSK